MKQFKVEVRKISIAEIIVDWVNNVEDAEHEANDMLCDKADINWEEAEVDVLRTKEIK